MNFVDTYDFLLLPLYLIVFWVIIKKLSKRYNGTELKKYFFLAFILQMTGSVFYSMLMQYYYGYSDSFGFMMGSDGYVFLYNNDISNLSYLFKPSGEAMESVLSLGYEGSLSSTMPVEANGFVMKVSSLISFLSFHRFLIISLFLPSFLLGSWKLFLVLDKVCKGKNTKLLAMGTLFMPSLWFWGSGLQKEPLCILAMGLLVYFFYKNFIIKKIKIHELLLSALMLYVLFVVKSYIAVILLAGLAICGLFWMVKAIKNILLRWALGLLISLALLIGLNSADFSVVIEEAIQISYKEIEQWKSTYKYASQEEETSRAGFSISDLEPSLESLIIHAPEVIATCLFRPFIWESKKLIIFLASLESLITLLATAFVFWKTRIIGFFIHVFGDAWLFYAFVVSMLFALLIGYTTFNFGTMIRYKIVFLPFYYFMLIRVYSRSKQNSIMKANGAAAT